MSVFPQFVDANTPFAPQFVILVCAFSLMLILVHLVYALGARCVASHLRHPNTGRWINRVSGSAFVLFGVLLAGARR